VLDNNKISLAKYRLEHASQCLKAANTLLEIGDFKGAANRSYYAIFHAMRAIFALDGLDFKKHSGLISEFRKRYIKSGLLSEKLSDNINELFQVRTDSDYDDFYLISHDEVREQIQNAYDFIKEVRHYLNTLLPSNF